MTADDATQEEEWEETGCSFSSGIEAALRGENGGSGDVMQAYLRDPDAPRVAKLVAAACQQKEGRAVILPSALLPLLP